MACGLDFTGDNVSEIMTFLSEQCWTDALRNNRNNNGWAQHSSSTGRGTARRPLRVKT